MKTGNSDSASYEIIEELGVGGFGRTFKMRVLDPDRVEEFGAEVVALKQPHGDNATQRQFRKEVSTNAALHDRLKGLRSENLVRFLGPDVFNGELAMVMEYVPHGTLRRIIGPPGKTPSLSLDEAIAVAEGILEGVSLIHQESVFHRDLKPENIFMAGKTPKVGDFGLSRKLAPGVLASTKIGTLWYAPPELLSRGTEGAGFAADVWSAGVMLYEMMTGNLPFGDLETPQGLMIDLILHEEPICASEVCQEVPEDLSDLIHRALSKNPMHRFLDGHELLLELKRCRQRLEGDILRELSAVRSLSFGVDGPEAIERKFRGIVSKFPRDPRAYQHLGEFYNRCQRYNEAVKTFEQGLAIDQRVAVLHYNLAVAYNQVGRARDAVRELEQALELGPEPGLRRSAKILLGVLNG